MALKPPNDIRLSHCVVCTMQAAAFPNAMEKLAIEWHQNSNIDTKAKFCLDFPLHSSMDCVLMEHIVCVIEMEGTGSDASSFCKCLISFYSLVVVEPLSVSHICVHFACPFGPGPLCEATQWLPVISKHEVKVGNDKGWGV